MSSKKTKEIREIVSSHCYKWRCLRNKEDELKIYFIPNSKKILFFETNTRKKYAIK